MEGIKGEKEEILSQNKDDWLSKWTEPEEGKYDLKVKKDEVNQIEVSNEDDYDCYSDEDIETLESERTADEGSKGSRTNAKRTLDLDAQIEKLCEGTPLSETVANRCTFKCPDCGELFTSWRSLATHFKKIHGGTLFLARVNKCTLKASCHICKICSTKVLSDVGFITRHLEMAHDMKVGQYTKKYCLNLNALIEKLCDGAPVSGTLANKCTFKCPECGEIFEKWRSLREHFSKIHHSTIHLRDVNKCIMDANCIVCKICSRKVLSDSVFILRHLSQHDMNVGQYIKKFGFDTRKAEEEVTYSDMVLGNFCTYQCYECRGEFHSKMSLQEHKRTASHGKGSRKRHQLIKIAYHKCKLCQKSVFCDICALNEHFKRIHKITLRDYCKKTGCSAIQNDQTCFSLLTSLKLSKAIDSVCTFACSACNKTYEKYSDFRKHRGKQQTLGIQCTLKLVKAFAYRCEICFQLMLCDEGIIRDHLKRHTYKNSPWMSSTTGNYEKFCKAFKADIPISTIIYDDTMVPVSRLTLKETAPQFGNLCTFCCSYCDSKNYQSWPALMTHSKNVHGTTVAFSRSVVQTARYHMCLMCPNAIINDRYFLLRHLYNAHRMNISKYEKIFHKHGGKTLPSFQDWTKLKFDVLKQNSHT